MNPHYGEVASEAISAAGLPPTTERNATRLLALVSADSGHAVITWAALAALWDCSQAVARRHLGHIKSAGIIHYSSNQDVYVNFYAWEPSKISTEIVEKFDGKRAWERDEQAPDPHTPDADVPGSSKNSTNIARGRAIFVEFFDEYRAPGGDNRGGRLVGSNLTTLPSENLLPTNQPVARPRWETESSEGLLLALGCENLPAIRETARTVPFEEIRAHALAWQRDTKAQSPGGLLHRIRSGDFAIPEITSADRESSLFLRWRTPAELAAEQERERLAAEENQRWEEERRAAALTPPSNAPVPVEPPAEAVKIWAAALADLAQSLPAPTYETWVRDTNVLSYADGEFEIGVPHAQARDWLHHRLRTHIKRTLSRLQQRSVEVTFAVRPRPQSQEAHP